MTMRQYSRIHASLLPCSYCGAQLNELCHTVNNTVYLSGHSPRRYGVPSIKRMEPERYREAYEKIKNEKV